MSDDAVMWCVRCGARFGGAEVAAATDCPACGTNSVPCDPSRDFLVEINWHELRVLGIWATNWAQEKCDEPQQQCVAAILGRLQRQFPEEAPLTVAGELRSLRKQMDMELVNVPPERFNLVNGPGAVGHGRRHGE